MIRSALAVRAASAGQSVDTLKSGRADAGFVAEALQRHGVEGATIAPPGGAP